jgi:AhpD family alkylhydroperoxidase
MQINYADINKRALDLLLSTKKHVGSIDPSLKALIELRVSQINGCAYCVDLHTNEARTLGVNQQKLDCLTVWKESGLFTEAEMAAMDWAENVTKISNISDMDVKLDGLLKHFNETETVDLTFIVVTMNALNRLAISFGDKPKNRDIK